MANGPARRPRRWSRWSTTRAGCSTARPRPALREPAALHEVAVDDEVAPLGGDHLPVAAAHRRRRPPAVLDQPGLAHGLDLAAVDRLRPALGAPRARRAARGLGEPLHGSQGSAPGGARARASRGPRAGSAAPPPARRPRAPGGPPRAAAPRAGRPARRAASAGRPPAGPGPRRAGAAPRRAPAGRPAAARSTSRIRRGSASASRNVTRTRQVPPSTSRAESTAARMRAAAALAAREQPVDQQAERALELGARRRLRAAPGAPPGARTPRAGAAGCRARARAPAPARPPPPKRSASAARGIAASSPSVRTPKRSSTGGSAAVSWRTPSSATGSGAR